MSRFQCDIAVAPAHVAINVIAGHAFSNDIDTFDAHVVDGLNPVIADGLPELSGVVSQSADDLATIAATGSPAQSVCFQKRDLVSTLSEFKRGIDAGEAGPNHGDICFDGAIQCRIIACAVGGCSVIGGSVLGSVYRKLQSKHFFNPWGQ